MHCAAPGQPPCPVPPRPQAAYLVRQLDIASPSENFHMVLIVAFHAAILGTMVGPHPTLYARYR